MARSSSSGDASLNFGTSNVLAGAATALWSLWIKLVVWDVAYQNWFNKDDYPTQAAGWNIQRNNLTNDVGYSERGSGTASFFSMSLPSEPFGWTHFAVWRDSTTQVRFYRSGSLISNSSIVGRNPFGNTASPMFVGVGGPNQSTAEAAIWKNITLANAVTIQANLAAGRLPTAQATQPVFYAPLSDGGATERDLVGGLVATVPVNSTPVTGPPIDILTTYYSY